MFSFIAQFWNSITSVLVGGVTYGIDFFQNIGVAVAGAIGSFFLVFLQYIYDFFVSITYVFQAFLNILPILLAPLYFIFDFFGSAVPSPTDFNNASSTISGVSSSATTFFNLIFGSSTPFGSIYAFLWALTLFALTFRLFKSFKKL